MSLIVSNDSLHPNGGGVMKFDQFRNHIIIILVGNGAIPSAAVTKAVLVRNSRKWWSIVA